jgi:hypothetical protein
MENRKGNMSMRQYERAHEELLAGEHEKKSATGVQYQKRYESLLPWERVADIVMRSCGCDKAKCYEEDDERVRRFEILSTFICGMLASYNLSYVASMEVLSYACIKTGFQREELDKAHYHSRELYR